MLRKRYLWLLLIVPALWVLVLAVQVIPAVGNAKDYIRVIQGNYSAQSANKSAERVSADVNRIFSTLSVPVVKQLTGAFGVNFDSVKDELRAVVEAGPILAGGDSPKKYLVAFQNSAEARGTGGILGAYALIEVDKGSVKVLRTGSNAPLYGISLQEIPVEVPKEFLKLYGKNPAILQNSNLSPHFPYGAEIWLGLWKTEFGEDLDGVIAVDPTALSYILKATGPITLKSGEQITSDNVVEQTLKTAYKKYEADNNARKQYLVDIMNAASVKLTSGQYSKVTMAKGLRDGILANRILIYSLNKDAQSTLSKVRLGGFMRTKPNNEFRTVIQNIDASKLDYYLDRDVTIESMSCDRIKQTQVRIKVTNTLATGVGLSAYVLTRLDKGKPASLVTGAHRFKVFVYGPVGSKLVSVSRENRTANLGGSSTERKRPIYVADVDLAPGDSEELLANFSGGVGSITFVDQPLVRETSLTVKDKC
jgi:hypothetical protein